MEFNQDRWHATLRSLPGFLQGWFDRLAKLLAQREPKRMAELSGPLSNEIGPPSPAHGSCIGNTKGRPVRTGPPSIPRATGGAPDTR